MNLMRSIFFAPTGVEAIFCNHNCFVNENVFTIQEVEKKYDAIYNATLAPYKRQELAAKVESLAIITYRYGGTYDSEHEKNDAWRAGSCHLAR